MAFSFRPQVLLLFYAVVLQVRISSSAFLVQKYSPALHHARSFCPHRPGDTLDRKFGGIWRMGLEKPLTWDDLDDKERDGRGAEILKSISTVSHQIQRSFLTL